MVSSVREQGDGERYRLVTSDRRTGGLSASSSLHSAWPMMRTPNARA